MASPYDLVKRSLTYDQKELLKILLIVLMLPFRSGKKLFRRFQPSLEFIKYILALIMYTLRELRFLVFQFSSQS